VYYRFIQGWEVERVFAYMFDTLFFTDPFWMAAHNLLHAPLVLLGMLGATWAARQAPGTWRRWWFWFAAGCLVHTIIDVLTHVEDGPLLFFPLNWTFRFRAPVSYWDPRYFGGEFAIFEIGLNLVLLAYLLIPVVRRRWGRGDGVTG
jgi:membrane-bound metal-dependent hydrolase YbcI (DUF457 family)